MLTNILGGIAALFLAVSAYFAWENKKEYEKQVGLRQVEERELDAAQKKLQKTRDEVAVAEEDLADKTATLEKLTDDLGNQNNIVADLEGQIDDKKLTIADSQQDLDEAEEAVANAGDPEELIADVRKYKLEIAELTSEIASAEAQRASLNNTSDFLNNKIDAARGRISLYTKQQSDPNLSTTVGSVYGGYGFVTVRGGDAKGIIKGSTLRVMRGNDTIAKLLVTAVEANTAAANIIPDTLADGTSVYPGDKVVAEVN